MIVSTQELAHTALDELWITKENLPFQPTEDIDMVWVISAVGTVKEVPDHGVYNEVLFDLNVVEEGVRIVKEVTGLRLCKSSEDVTKDDIESHGPVLFYNGDSAASKGYRFDQNEHFKEMIDEPDFPIPRSKIEVGVIEEGNTPGQIKGFVKLLSGAKEMPSKVAVVCAFQQSPRVGRYIKHYQELLPEGVNMVSAPVTQFHNEGAIAADEVRKLIRYYRMGDLAVDSYFPTEGQSKRPDLRRSHRN